MKLISIVSLFLLTLAAATNAQSILQYDSTGNLSTVAPGVLGAPVITVAWKATEELNVAVTSAGIGSLTYQWFENGTPIPGATNMAVPISNALLPSQYSVMVCSPLGCATSSIPNELLVWLPFAGNAADASGNGYNGVVQSAVLTTNRFGVADSAYHFDGTDTITVTNLDPDNYPNEFSFGAWFRPDATPSGMMGWHDDGGGSGTYILFEDGSIHFRVGTGSGTDHKLTTPIPLHEWSHLFISHTLTNDAFYLNGQLMGNWPSYPIQLNSPTFQIGTAEYNGNFIGAIDDVTVYRWGMPANEVLNIYLGSLHPPSQRYPVISANPRSLRVVPGKTAQFGVTALSLESLTYQWRKEGTNLTNGGNITGADTDTLTLTEATTNDAGNYDVAVSNVAGTLTSQAAELTVLPDVSLRDMLLWLPFDGNANDVSGNDHDGVVQGAVLTTNRFGAADSAYRFDGTATITVTNVDPDNYANGFSFGAWFRPDTTTSGMMGWHDDGGWGGTYILYEDGSIHFRMGTGIPNTDYKLAIPVPLAKWSHIFITHGLMNDAFYLNGQLAGIWPTYPLQLNSATLQIGLAEYNGNFHGAIDDVTVFARELSTNEVGVVYQSGSSVVSDSPIFLLGPTIASVGFSFNLTAQPGSRFVIQASTNLIDWNTIQAATISPSGTNNIIDSITPGTTQMFYRVIKQ